MSPLFYAVEASGRFKIGQTCPKQTFAGAKVQHFSDMCKFRKQKNEKINDIGINGMRLLQRMEGAQPINSQRETTHRCNRCKQQKREADEDGG